MYLMIDNYDSFVYNLACYFEENGAMIKTLRNDAVRLSDIEQLLASGILEGIILSPGPKTPADSGCCIDVVRQFAGRIPIFGVCLGHQIIGHVFGADICKGERPMHGKVTPVTHRNSGIFSGLPETFHVTRYHSLIVRPSSLPDTLGIDCVSEDNVIMGLHHKYFPIYGVQFHPEAVLTEYGHELIHNFMKLCKEWRITHADNSIQA